MLGQIGIEHPDHPGAAPLVVQVKPFTLLCYLAVAHPQGYHRRDSLIALFWPELDHEHGRATLRQALRIIRQELGDQVLLTRGQQEIALDTSRVGSDAADLTAAVADGHPDRVVALYGGEFLPGLHVQGAGLELDEWLEDVRTRFRQQALTAARSALSASRTAGDRDGMLRLTHRIRELDPFDEGPLRILMQLFDQDGHRSAAIREFETFAARLFRDCASSPSAETLALAGRLRTGPAAGGAPTPQYVPAGALARRDDEDAAVRAYADAIAPRARAPARARRWPLILACVLLAALALSGIRRDPLPTVPTQSNLVLVLPWRVTNADAGLGYLREGMVDLLGATLTGERGLRATDARTVLQLLGRTGWRSPADISPETGLSLARHLGAQWLLQGAVLGHPNQVTLVLTEYAVNTGLSAGSMELAGPVDSLPVMVPRLAAQLVARHAGGAARQAGLLATSLPALQAYLEGRAAFRRGLYNEAASDFDRALAIDTGFTLAALELATGALTNDNGTLLSHGQAVAWRDSARLSPRDRALLKGRVGSRYPVSPDDRDLFDNRAEAVALAPESPEAWYWLADSYFHEGRVLGLPDWSARAVSGFERAIALDSGYESAYQHLIELELSLGDTVGVRQLAATYFALDSAGEYRDYLRWRLAAGLGDSAALRDIHREFDRFSRESLWRVVGAAQIEGVDLEGAELARSSLHHRTAGTAARWIAAYAGETLRLNEGRPAASLAFEPDMVADPRRPLTDLWFRITDAIYGDADSVAAARAVLGLTPLAEAPNVNGAAADTQVVARCAVGLWRSHHGAVQQTGQLIEQLTRRARQDSSPLGIWMNGCAVILAARSGALSAQPTVRTPLARLDSMVRAGAGTPLRLAAALELAELEAGRGSLRAALLAVERRENNYNPRYLSTELRVEGRLALQLGDTARAIRDYRHYLLLRSAPEASRAPEVDSVRTLLSSLLRSASPAMAVQPRSRH